MSGMGRKGLVATAAVLVAPLSVSLTGLASPASTSSSAPVPLEASHWLLPAQGAVRRIDLRAACRDLLESPETATVSLTPAQDVDRIARGVAIRLAPLYPGRFERVMYPNDKTRLRIYDDPAVRLRGGALDDVRFGIGQAHDSPVAELFERAIPWEAFVAYVAEPETRVYAVAEPLDEAAEKLRARLDVIAPRIVCGLSLAYGWQDDPASPRAKLHAEGNVRKIDVPIPTGRCVAEMGFELRLVRRGDVTFIVGGGRATYEDGMKVGHDARIAAALE